MISCLETAEAVSDADADADAYAYACANRTFLLPTLGTNLGTKTNEKVAYIFTRRCLVGRFLGFLRVLPSFPMPPLTYCKMAGPKYVVSKSQSKKSRNKHKTPKHLHTKSPTHLYESDMNPQKGWAAASPPPTPFGDGYGICISAWVILCAGVSFFCFCA